MLHFENAATAFTMFISTITSQIRIVKLNRVTTLCKTSFLVFAETINKGLVGVLRIKQQGFCIRKSPVCKAQRLTKRCTKNLDYFKNRYVHFNKNMFLACSAKAFRNRLFASLDSRSAEASGVFPCDHTRYSSEPALYSHRTIRLDRN